VIIVIFVIIVITGIIGGFFRAALAQATSHIPN